MVYLIHAIGTDRYKIGYTQAEKKNRLRFLQTACPFELEIVKIFQEGTVYDEAYLHKKYDNNRIIGEWFVFSKDQMKEEFEIIIKTDCGTATTQKYIDELRAKNICITDVGIIKIPHIYAKKDKNMDGDYVKKCRKTLGLTQQQLADRIGVSKSTIRSWEQDNRIISNIALKFLDRLLKLQQNARPVSKIAETYINEIVKQEGK